MQAALLYAGWVVAVVMAAVWWWERRGRDGHARAAQVGARGKGRVEIGVLDRACTAGVSGMAITGDGSIARVRFVEVTHDALTVQLLDVADAAIFAEPGVAFLQMMHGGRTRMFLSEVKGVRNERPRPLLTLAIPSQIAHADARASFRVPLDDIAADVLVERGDAQWSAELVDISRAGAGLLIQPAAQTPDRGDALEVTIRCAGYEVTLPAEVRRADHGSYGIVFTNAMTAYGEVRPPEALAELVGFIEAQHLRASTHTADPARDAA